MIFNLLGKTLLENSIGALKHHLKKKEVQRNTEIECQKEIQIAKIKEKIMNLIFYFISSGEETPRISSPDFIVL